MKTVPILTGHVHKAKYPIDKMTGFRGLLYNTSRLGVGDVDDASSSPWG